MFNYQNLGPGQFEELCRDIMQVITGKQLHVFSTGRDGGVDLTDDSDKHNIVVQVKHYENSSFTLLRNNLEKEIEKVKKLNPKQYYVCASQRLTDSNVNTIYQMFSDYMESTNSILTLDDIDCFLHKVENIQITRNHTKLWLESGVTLQLLGECFPQMRQELEIIVRKYEKDMAIKEILYNLARSTDVGFRKDVVDKSAWHEANLQYATESIKFIEDHWPK